MSLLKMLFRFLFRHTCSSCVYAYVNNSDDIYYHCKVKNKIIVSEIDTDNNNCRDWKKRQGKLENRNETCGSCGNVKEVFVCYGCTLIKCRGTQEPILSRNPACMWWVSKSEYDGLKDEFNRSFCNWQK